MDLTKAQRAEVRKRFADSPVKLAGLGSAFEYQAADPAVVRRNIEGTKEYVRLAHDLGSPGVKVRPNGIPAGPTSTRPSARSAGRSTRSARTPRARAWRSASRSTGRSPRS
ncbi:MAG: hypothetical protein U0790_06285 [Isosphaeraceae bacterium]